MIKVKNGQDPYSVIGRYIRDHVSAIEDMIAVIEIDGKTSNELFMVDMKVDGYFIWGSDWYEGEENVVLIDFFPVSDACNPKDHWIPCSESERLPEDGREVLGTDTYGHVRHVIKDKCGDSEFATYEEMMHIPIIAWTPLPDPYQRGEEE